MVCSLCDLCVHAACDATLTKVSIELLNSDSHPAVCYHCSNCRSSEQQSSRSRLKERVGGLETQLNKLLKQVRPLIHNLAVKTNCEGDANPSKNDSQILLLDSESDENPPKSQEGSISLSIEATKYNHKLVKELPTNKCDKKSTYELSVICTNVKEPNDTLLQSRDKHDREEWMKLCKRMQLKQIEPVTLTRLSRSPNSPHRDKARLLKVTVRTEKDLESILLSAYLLQNGSENVERVFADVPW